MWKDSTSFALCVQGIWMWCQTIGDLEISCLRVSYDLSSGWDVLEAIVSRSERWKLYFPKVLYVTLWMLGLRAFVGWFMLYNAGFNDPWLTCAALTVYLIWLPLLLPGLSQRRVHIVPDNTFCVAPQWKGFKLAFHVSAVTEGTCMWNCIRWHTPATGTTTKHTQSLSHTLTHL